MYILRIRNIFYSKIFNFLNTNALGSAHDSCFCCLQLEQSLKDGTCDGELIAKLVNFPFTSNEIPWETKLGVLLGAKVFTLEGNPDENVLKIFAPAGKRDTFSKLGRIVFVFVYNSKYS